MMNKFTTFLLALVLCYAANGQEPAITMTTLRPLGSVFSFSVRSQVENTPIKVDFGDGRLVDYTIGTSVIKISGMLVGSQTMKVYGAGIAYLDCMNNRLIALNVSGDPDLIDLSCDGNQLSTLDVTKNTELVNFDCSFNQLTAIDVSKNTKLYTCRCSNNQLTALDVSYCSTSMWDLSCNNNNLTSIDISKSRNLSSFNCSNNQLTVLDITNNNLLYYFHCDHNELTDLNVSNNSLLYDLNCSDNELTNLDLSQNTSLTSVSLENNRFTFASLPHRQSSWTQFSYAPQKPISILTSFKIGETIDLSSQATVDNDSTVYAWKTAFGTTLVPGIDYSTNRGKTTFFKVQQYFVYCEMSNAIFSDFTGDNVLKTTYTEIKDSSKAMGEVSIISMTSSEAVGSDIKFDLQAKADSTPVKVDFGDGVLVDWIIGTCTSTINGTIVGANIKIYGTDIIYFDCRDEQLTSLDVTQCPALQSLNCSGSQLTSLDVTMNSLLSNLTCDRNQITTLDVSKNNLLLSFSCTDNKLTSLDLSNNPALIGLICTNNLLNTLDISKSAQLSYLLCSYNQLSTLDLTNNPGLTFVFCYNNKLTSLDVSKNSSLLYLYCLNNSLASLDLTNTRVTDLSCGFNQLTSLNLTKDAWLQYLYCYNNKLTTIDLTQNTALNILMCNDNQLTSLDLTKNARLAGIDCSNNKLTSLNVTQNLQLGGIGCNNNKLTNLDLSQNTGLMSVNCDNNLLTNLDVSRNTGLYYLSCNNNQLTSLDLSQNNNLYYLYCSGNNMSFATLPAIQNLYNEYKYAPQKAIIIPNFVVIGAEIDLSNQLQINGKTSVYDWKTQNGVSLIPGTDYAISNGKTVFLKAQSDSVYCEMTNVSFPDLSGTNVLRTVNTKIMGNAVVVMKTAKATGSRFPFKLKASANNTPVKVDFGNGIMIPKVIGTTWTTIKDTLAGSQVVKVYGSGITGLNCSNDQLIALDITNAAELTKLNCSDNKLTNLDISKNNELVKLVCSDNRLTSLDVNNNSILVKLNCSNNYFTFTSLPVNGSQWKSFSYAPQKPMTTIKSLSTNVELDLSDQLIINGDTTLYNWKTKSGKTLLLNSDYTITGGKTIFIRNQRDSVHCEMTNRRFPEFFDENALKTTNIKVTGNKVKASSETIDDGKEVISDENVKTPEVEIYLHNHTLYINLTYKAQMSIFDLSGKLILSKSLEIGTNDVELQNAGLYILKITGNEQQVARKVLIE